VILISRVRRSKGDNNTEAGKMEKKSKILWRQHSGQRSADAKGKQCNRDLLFTVHRQASVPKSVWDLKKTGGGKAIQGGEPAGKNKADFPLQKGGRLDIWQIDRNNAKSKPGDVEEVPSSEKELALLHSLGVKCFKGVKSFEKSL